MARAAASLVERESSLDRNRSPLRRVFALALVAQTIPLVLRDSPISSVEPVRQLHVTCLPSVPRNIEFAAAGKSGGLGSCHSPTVHLKNLQLIGGFALPRS